MTMKSLTIFAAAAAAFDLALNLASSSEPLLATGVPAVGFTDPQSCEVSDGCDNKLSNIDSVNRQLRPALKQLVATDFFRYFKLQLYKVCPFWQENAMCFSPDCAVELENLDVLKDNYSFNATGVVQYNCDYCNTAEEHQDDAVYLDLTLNPERFSGYGGEEAGRIWSLIYQENCFNDIDITPIPRFTNKYLRLLTSWSRKLQHNLSPVIDDQCLEKRVFYRLVSGMHGSIATHLSFEWLDLRKRNAGFEPNLQLWLQRVGYFNDRLSNIYFNYSLVTKALMKLSSYLNQIKFSDSNREKALIESIVDTLRPYENLIFDEKILFNYDDLSNQYLKNEFKSNFKNVSRLMDCVGCERCRLWGKVQTLGYGTSLKILFELNDDAEGFDVKSLKRSEIVALINTFDRLSKSIEIINYFREVYHSGSALTDSATSSVNDDIFSKNNKVISYQQKIFKVGNEQENQKKLDLQSKIVKSVSAEKVAPQKASSEEKVSAAPEKPSSQVPAEPKEPSQAGQIAQKNIELSKKNLKKLFKDKRQLKEEDLTGLTFEEIRYKKIFKNSIRLKNSKPNDEKVFRDHLDEVLEEFKDVFKFLWRSYIDFPRNCYILLMSRLEIYWNYFIGNEEFFIQKEKELYNLDY